MNVVVTPTFSGKALEPGAFSCTNSSGQIFSITRLSFLLSDFEFFGASGDSVKVTDSFAWIDVEKGRTSFSLAAPDGEFTRVRFHVGLSPKENHADPARFGPEHPLNPNFNGLHWNWQGGYVFLALEGLWKEADSVRGYSYHIATDAMLMRVELPLNPGARELALNFELDPLFRIRFTDTNATTHSRVGDDLASDLRIKIEKAFSNSASTAPTAKTKSNRTRALIAPNATPYRLQIPSFVSAPALPLDNPLTEEGVALGRRLFRDPKLSVNNQQSCASCHQRNAAFSDVGKRFSAGAEGKLGARNAMSLFNLAWKSEFFWDGRAEMLREQVLMPIENPLEMHESLTNLVAKLQGIASYPHAFRKVFGSREINADRIARALEQFLLALVSFDSKFDRALRGETELNDQEKRGLELFQTEYDPRRGKFGADCFHCHGGPLFQSQTFANNGLDAVFRDEGRRAITGKVSDRGKFSVPSLRNVTRTGPYMHDGRFESLEAVVEHYSTGLKRSETLDPNLAKHPDGGVPMTTEDKKALIAFLNSL
jgi:cytochrome c peroxidase